jgi:hypothetical protein
LATVRTVRPMTVYLAPDAPATSSPGEKYKRPDQQSSRVPPLRDRSNEA